MVRTTVVAKQAVDVSAARQCRPLVGVYYVSYNYCLAGRHKPPGGAGKSQKGLTVYANMGIT